MKGFRKLRLWHSGIINAGRDVPESENELNNIEIQEIVLTLRMLVFSTTVNASYFLEISKYNQLASLPIIGQNTCVNECNRHRCSISDRRTCSKF
jgi:hypothetical protein